MDVIETQKDRTDLPLVVMPSVIPSMVKPFSDVLGLLHDVARVRMWTDATLDADEIVRRCEGADAVMVIGFHVTEGIYARLRSHVRCFAFGGTGVASYIDVQAAERDGIAVCNVVRYGDHAVAEHAMALVLELARHAGALDADVRAGHWLGSEGISLHGRTLGLVGFGGIGQAMASIASGFGMRIHAWNSHLHADAVERYAVTPVDSIRDLFASSDVVSLHLPLLDSTRGVITGRDLEALRPGTLFVNTARAEIIEQGALTRRLLRGDVPAGLDVFEHEPLPKDDPLLGIPGVVITPHVAWRTDEAYRGLTEQVVRSMAAFFTGSRVNRVV